MECPICLNIKPIITTICKHKICHSCIIKSGKPICPICRSNIEKSLSEDTIDIINFISEKDKQINKLEEEINILRSVYGQENINRTQFRNIFTIPLSLNTHPLNIFMTQSFF